MLAAALALPGASCTPIVPGEEGVARTAGNQWQVRWDPVLRTPSSIVNRALAGEDEQGTPASEASAIESVRRVFREQDGWFRLRPEDEFRPVSSHVRGFLRWVRFEQTYRGVSVGGGGYEANVLPSGRVASLEGRFVPDLVVDPTPRLPASEAESRARTAFPLGAPPSAPAPGVQFEIENGLRDRHELVIVPRSGNAAVLAWGVVVQTGSREWLRVYVDATTGAIVGRQPVGWAPER